MRRPDEIDALLAIAQVRQYASVAQVTLLDALVALTLQPEEVIDILDPLMDGYVEVPDLVTLAELGRHSAGARDAGLAMTARFLVDSGHGLVFVMGDVRQASRYLARWLHAAVVEFVAGESAADPRIAERIGLIRSWAFEGYDPTRQERHRLAMFDRSARFADVRIATALRAAAQDDDYALANIFDERTASEVRPRLAYACVGFRGVL